MVGDLGRNFTVLNIGNMGLGFKICDSHKPLTSYHKNQIFLSQPENGSHTPKVSKRRTNEYQVPSLIKSIETNGTQSNCNVLVSLIYTELSPTNQTQLVRFRLKEIERILNVRLRQSNVR